MEKKLRSRVKSWRNLEESWSKMSILSDFEGFLPILEEGSSKELNKESCIIWTRGSSYL